MSNFRIEFSWLPFLGTVGARRRRLVVEQRSKPTEVAVRGVLSFRHTNNATNVSEPRINNSDRMAPMIHCAGMLGCYKSANPAVLQCTCLGSASHQIDFIMKQILSDSDLRRLSGAVARDFGITPEQSDAAIRELTDAVAIRMGRTMLSRGGVADMTSLLINPDVGILGAPDAQDQGNQVLDTLTGSKHVSRRIAARAASIAGIGADKAEAMLPVVANAILGTLRTEAGPKLQQIVNGIDAGGPLPFPGEPRVSEGPSASAPSSTPSAGHPDYGSPLPLPGEIPTSSRRYRPPPETPQPGGGSEGGDDDGVNPYDRLPDIVRRGRTPAPGGGGSIEDVIRNILNSLLGNGSRGVIGTMIQLFIIRFLASLIRRFFARLGGR